MVETAADQCDTADKWFQRRGEIAALRFVLGAKGQAEAALKGLPDREFPDEPPKAPHRNELEE